jgi:hypothetical protein
MKKHALAVFRMPPERLNCAQSVLHAWCEVSGDKTLAPADLKHFGGGRAPEGICGALHAACLAAPYRAGALKVAFAARLGSLDCKELRAAKVHPCEICVGLAAELLEVQAVRKASPDSTMNQPASLEKKP